MEVGGVGANSTPWTLGATAMSGLKAAAVLHYELFPYLYGLLQRRQPVLRPLAFDFPGDPKSWGANFETLVGPDLLAAPVAGPGTSPTVYRPPGSGVDLYSGTKVAGGRRFTRQTPLDQFPLYVREGAVVPFNLRTASGSWWGVNELAHPGRAGFLATNGATLALSGQPSGVQLFVPAARPPHRVTLAGKAVAWSWNPGPLPGIVIRLHGPADQGRDRAHRRKLHRDERPREAAVSVAARGCPRGPALRPAAKPAPCLLPARRKHRRSRRDRHQRRPHGRGSTWRWRSVRGSSTRGSLLEWNLLCGASRPTGSRS